MIQVPPRFAAIVAAAVASAALFAGTVQAGVPLHQGSEPGTGTATSDCRSSMPPQGDVLSSLCVARVTPGAPGPAVGD
jgi:hypothetical protein